MAKFVSKDLDLFLNGNKLSSSVASVTINEEVDDIETTAFNTNLEAAEEMVRLYEQMALLRKFELAAQVADGAPDPI